MLRQAARGSVKSAEAVVAFLRDLPGKRTTPEQERLAARLRSELTALASLPEGNQVDFWRDTCAEMVRLAQTRDPLYFMHWPPIIKTMVVNTRYLSIQAFRLLRRSPRWHSMWSKAIRHPSSYGHPPPFLLYPASNGNMIQFAAHLEAFQTSTGANFLDADCVVELGAGYGGMCWLMRRLGYRGHYIIFDQPPFLALQRYYLGLNSIAAEYDARTANTTLCRSVSEIKTILADRGFKRVSLVSNWALSEMPLSVRAEIEPVLSNASKVLLSYQSQFTDMDNRSYFSKLIDRTKPRLDWRHFEIEYFPDNYYALALSRSTC